MKRHGRPPLRAKRYVHRPGAYAILPRGNAVLLTVQRDPVPEYQLPGGGIDPGEQPLQALRREILEETGWVVGQLLRRYAYRRFTFMPDYQIWAEKVCIVYIARPVRRLGAPLEPGHSAVFLPSDQAVECLASAGDRACLKSFLDRQPRL